MQGQQVFHGRFGRQLHAGFTRQIPIGDAGLFHGHHIVRLGQVAEGEIAEQGIFRQGVARGGQHVLRIVRIAVRISGIIAVGTQGDKAIPVFRFFHRSIGNVHQIAHDVLLGILILASFVADDIKVELGDDAIRGFSLENEGVVFGLAGRRGSCHFILCGKRLNLSFFREGGGTHHQDHNQQYRTNLFHADILLAFRSLVWEFFHGA